MSARASFVAADSRASFARYDWYLAYAHYSLMLREFTLSIIV